MKMTDAELIDFERWQRAGAEAFWKFEEELQKDEKENENDRSRTN